MRGELILYRKWAVLAATWNSRAFSARSSFSRSKSDRLRKRSVTETNFLSNSTSINSVKPPTEFRGCETVRCGSYTTLGGHTRSQSGRQAHLLRLSVEHEAPPQHTPQLSRLAAHPLSPEPGEVSEAEAPTVQGGAKHHVAVLRAEGPLLQRLGEEFEFCLLAFAAFGENCFNEHACFETACTTPYNGRRRLTSTADLSEKRTEKKPKRLLVRNPRST